jgi:hypothetical protein
MHRRNTKHLRPAWKPGQSGNPKGRPKGQPVFRDALLRVLHEHTGTGAWRRTKLEAIARRLVEDAIKVGPTP